MKQLFFTLSLLTGTISDVYANVATVETMRGQVRAKLPDGKLVDLKKGMQLIEGSTVQTAPKSFARLKLQDDSTLSLGPDSQMLIEALSPSQAGVVSLVKGQLRGQVNKEANEGDNKLIIKTKTAAMGVRGTDLQVVYNPENNVSSVVTFQGEVAQASLSPGGDAEAALQSNNVVSVRQGQYSGVNPKVSNRATTAVRMSPAQINVMKNSQNTGLSGRASNLTAKMERNPVPPGINPRLAIQPAGQNLSNSLGSIVGANRVENLERAQIPDTNLPPPEGSFNRETGEVIPPAGGLLDLKTGLYVPPPPGSSFDPDAGVFIPPSNLGSFDANTGDYVPPAGFELKSDGTFKAAQAVPTAETSVAGSQTGAAATEGGAPVGGEQPAPPPALVSAEQFGQGYDAAANLDDVATGSGMGGETMMADRGPRPNEANADFMDRFQDDVDDDIDDAQNNDLPQSSSINVRVTIQ